jgi:NTE family protein
VTVFFSACAHERHAARIDRIDPERDLGPVRDLTPADERNSDDLVVLLAFSGGGTRAAALAYGVLEALETVKVSHDGVEGTMLDEVDSISSVSGGSFTASYYALFGRELFAEFPEKMLYRRLGLRIFWRLMNPWNWIRLRSIYLSRSDIAAELYDDLLFHGATFRDVREHGYANLAVQATDLIEESRFSFTPDFFSRLCLDLMDFPIARAVTASSAFPGPFAPILVKNEAGQCGYPEEPWIAKAINDHDAATREYQLARIYRLYQNREKKKYVHLVDGGISDNLGIRGPLESVMTHGGFLNMVKSTGLNNTNLRIAVIVVNAATGTPKTMRLEYVMPSMLQVMNAASTVMLNRYSFETVALLRTTLKEWADDWKKVNPEAPKSFQFYISQVSFDALLDEKEKEELSEIPTQLGLPREDVDRLRAAAKTILFNSPDFRRLAKDLNAEIPEMEARR